MKYNLACFVAFWHSLQSIVCIRLTDLGFKSSLILKLNILQSSGYHDRKALYLMRGLSGSGKSTYARYVAFITAFRMIFNMAIIILKVSEITKKNNKSSSFLGSDVTLI